MSGNDMPVTTGYANSFLFDDNINNNIYNASSRLLLSRLGFDDSGWMSYARSDQPDVESIRSSSSRALYAALVSGNFSDDVMDGGGNGSEIALDGGEGEEPGKVPLAIEVSRAN